MSLRGLQKHLASHQQQLALFALPPNLDDTEEDDEDEEDEEGPLDVEDSDEEDLSDTSDVHLPAEESSIDAEPRISFTDAVGRKYNPLWQTCKKWKVCKRHRRSLFWYLSLCRSSTCLPLIQFARARFPPLR